MPELSFTVEDVAAVPFAVSPQLSFCLRVKNAIAGEEIQAIALHCQLQIEATRRQYNANEQELLGELFGEPHRWGQTLRTMLWTHANAAVPQFTGETTAALHVPCTFDFNVAATKFFYALSDGGIPISFQFSGTIFYRDASGALQIAPVPWNQESRFPLPVKVWRQLVEHYYPNSSWLCLRRDVFDRLYQYKLQRGIPTWEQVLEDLLPALHEVRS